MSDFIKPKTKSRLDKFLPHAIRDAIRSYEEFITKPEDEDLDFKDFSTHHKSCKAALAHLDVLLKLERLTIEKEQYEAHPNLKDQIVLAEKNVQKYQDSLKQK